MFIVWWIRGLPLLQSNSAQLLSLLCIQRCETEVDQKNKEGLLTTQCFQRTSKPRFGEVGYCEWFTEPMQFWLQRVVNSPLGLHHRSLWIQSVRGLSRRNFSTFSLINVTEMEKHLDPHHQFVLAVPPKDPKERLLHRWVGRKPPRLIPSIINLSFEICLLKHVTNNEDTTRVRSFYHLCKLFCWTKTKLTRSNL